MIWVLIVFSTILSCELVIRIPFIRSAHDLRLSSQKAIKIIKSSSISDHWKEKILPYYAVDIAKLSLLTFVYLLFALSPFLLVGFLSGQFGLNVFELISTPASILAITVLAWVYFALRKRFL